ncbi:MAG TPA: pyrroline-5-carboxylate reductase [Proteobacteria bacterium]|nr:pyrroline-5-carboxylate reductase [Pseudomonadota bacterium]
MKKITFIGAGNMGEALIRGIIADGLFTPDAITAAEPDEARREKLEQELEINTTGDNREAVRGADIVCLAIKPQILDSVLEGISEDITEDHILVSILAGVPTRRIEDKLGKKVRVVRVMPNTPALVRSGMAGISSGRYAGPDDLRTGEEIMSAVGDVLRVPEELIDAVTGVSGSGPAYLFYFVEVLSRAGVKAGLSPEQADLLARKTVIGAAKLMEETGLSPEELRRKVTSPGGTTEAALKTFEKLGFEKIMEKAVLSARDRAREMGKTDK